jgi:hypothetical protein
MTEQHIVTEIGNDVRVWVFFDHEEAEAETHDCPASPEVITINSVIVVGGTSDCILDICSNDILSLLIDRCQEQVDTDAREAYEMSQEER